MKALYIVLLCFCLNINIRAQNENPPQSVYTSEVVQLYQYDENNGRMINFTEGKIRIEKRYYKKGTRLIGGNGGYENGFRYTYNYELIAYKNNEVWINIIPGYGISHSDIQGYNYRLYFYKKECFLYIKDI